MIRNSATVICLVLAFASMIGAQTSAPSVNSGGALNAASYSGVVAPGSIAAVFGSFLLNSPSTAEFVPLPTNISGLSFEFGSGVLSPLFYVSGGQVNLQVPWELTGEAQVPVTASLGGNAGNAQTVALAPFAPGIFAMNGQGTGQGAILNSTYHLANGSSPATAGSDIVQIFCTGLGPVTNQPPTGSPASSSLLSMTTTNPTVTIGGAPATVQFSGLAPGLVGVYQVNALVPAASIAGAAVPVTITIGSAISNTVTMAVNAPVGPGTLQINITGLLSGTSASVSVTSLNGFSAVVTTNQALTVPSGVYTVFANTVPAGSMTYGAFPTQQLATVTPGSTTTIQVPYTAIIPQTTQTLDQQGAQGLSVSTDASTLTISAASPVAQSLAPGSVLAIGVTPATPNGLLRKVVSVAQNGSLIVATTTQATLADAFAQADFSFGTQFTIQNAYVRTLRPGVRVVRPHKYVAPFGTRQTAQDACTSDNGIPVQMFDTPIAEDDNGSITLTGEIDICPSLNFNWQIGGFPPSLQTLTATATLAEGSQITIRGSLQQFI